MAVAAIIIAAASSAVLADVMTWNTFVPLTSGAYNGIVSDAGGNHAHLSSVVIKVLFIR